MVVQAIQEWNNLNAAERAVTLLPVRWETHSAPALGDRPQAIINRQIVDECDALIGVFWTRFGSPTGTADSGTLEEIERTVNAGKPAMLYFSSAPQIPDQIDPEQLQKLREFKKRIQNQGLIQAYSSLTDFKDLLVRHLEHQVRTWLSSKSESSDGAHSTTPTADIKISFDKEAMKLDEVDEDGSVGKLATKYLSISDPENIPDYGIGGLSAKKGIGILATTLTENLNYYRDSAAKFRDQAFRRVILKVENAGSIGARDVYFDVELTGTHALTVATTSELMLETPSSEYSWAAKKSRVSHEKSTRWLINDELGAMQPQRVRQWAPNTYIAAWEDCEVRIDVTIYADIFPQPIKRALILKWTCNPIEMTSVEFMQIIVGSTDPANAALDTKADN